MAQSFLYQVEMFVMNKKITTFAVSTALFFSSHIQASNIPDENNICKASGDTIFAFFNGVMTPHDLAVDNLDILKNIHGTTTPDGGTIDYDVMYNHSNGYEDFVETFEQRFEEQHLLRERWELFFQVLKDQGTWWDRINLSIPELIVNAGQWRQVLQANFIKNLSALLANPPATIANYEEHQTKIDSWILEGKKLLFVAHSQGNLFVNNAYNYTTSKISSESVQVIHIAPASPITNGSHVLADQDLVINGLRVFGSVPPVTHDIPIFKPFMNNHGRDFLGHGLIETYMNPAFGMYESIKGYVDTALATLKAPPTQASQGFFTVTLSWDGSGDVDLHTFEPSGSHVFYSNKQGTSGYLDVDNTHSFGPEHYFASCDKTKLSTGVYNISLANYARAEGRKATVQISSDAAGVLGTKSVVMGAETRNTPAFDMFNVRVNLNPETQKYSVSLE